MKTGQENGRNPKGILAGKVSFANGEVIEYTDPAKYLTEAQRLYRQIRQPGGVTEKYSGEISSLNRR